jgi:hypothetical protein
LPPFWTASVSNASSSGVHLHLVLFCTDATTAVGYNSSSGNEARVKACVGFSAPKHVYTLAGASSFDTDLSSLAPSTFFQDFLSNPSENGNEHVTDSHPASRWKAHYRQTGASEKKLEHSSLVALCAWTLEQVQGNEEATHDVPLQIETDMILTGQLSSSPAMTPLSPNKQGQRNQSSQHETNPTKRSKLLVWKKKQNAASRTGSFTAMETWCEEKKEDMPEPPPPSRLQMFGSESARHSSTSALAPAQNNHQSNTSRVPFSAVGASHPRHINSSLSTWKTPNRKSWKAPSLISS